jgi:hypothetical protein
MAELLDRIHADIRERLEARRPAAEEYARLEAALDALGGPVSDAPVSLAVAQEPPSEEADAPPLAA